MPQPGSTYLIHQYICKEAPVEQTDKKKIVCKEPRRQKESEEGSEREEEAAKQREEDWSFCWKALFQQG